MRLTHSRWRRRLESLAKSEREDIGGRHEPATRQSSNLVDGVLSGRVNRRELMQRAAALGIAVPGVLLARAAPDVMAAPRVTARAQDATPTPKAGGSLGSSSSMTRTFSIPW